MPSHRESFSYALLGAALWVLVATPVCAQTTRSTEANSCANYLKADEAAPGLASPRPENNAGALADPAMEAKVRAYCVANPAAPVLEAQRKAMGY
jgi:hypothetical protein